MRLPRLAAALLLGLALAGCDGDTVTGPEDEGTRDNRATTVAQFTAATARWRLTGPDRYRYTVRRTCFCTPDATAPARVTVENGVVKSVTRLDGGPADPADYPTVDGLLALIGEAIREDAAVIRVTYDATYGYPTALFVDRSQQMADEELRYEASDLTRQ